MIPKLQLGLELFHQTAAAAGTPATTSLGIGAKYDINENYHLLGYIRRESKTPTRLTSIPGMPRFYSHFEGEHTDPRANIPSL